MSKVYHKQLLVKRAKFQTIALKDIRKHSIIQVTDTVRGFLKDVYENDVELRNILNLSKRQDVYMVVTGIIYPNESNYTAMSVKFINADLDNVTFFLSIPDMNATIYANICTPYRIKVPRTTYRILYKLDYMIHKLKKAPNHPYILQVYCIRRDGSAMNRLLIVNSAMIKDWVKIIQNFYL